MSIPEKEKGDEVSAPPTNREEEEDREDEVELLAGVSSEDCHPTEQREKEDESVIQREKKDTTKPTEDEERFLAENLPSNHRRAQDKQKKDDSEPKIPQAQKVLEIAKQNCRELFVDQYGTPYAAVIVNEHLEVLSLNGKRFKNWLCKICYDTDNSIINSESLKNVINILKAQIEFGSSSRTKELHLRVGSRTDNAGEDSAIYYDLTNSPWEVVKVTPCRWSIEKAMILFRRYNNQRPQIYPSREYPQDIFDRFMELTNVKDEENKLLLKCYIISMFIPTIPKPVLILHGEQGSAKSTLLELIKTLIDPSIICTLSFPRDTNELVQQLFHNYIAYFDNISNIKEWVSDELCRAVTGSGFSKRMLFTDDDEVIYNFRRCIGFSGINVAASKADLLDRGLIIELANIPDDKKRSLTDIWKEFDRIRAPLLGYIFDILVKVLQIKKQSSIRLDKHPRMVDFAELAEIISRSMGYSNNQFIKVYYNNIGLQTQQALEANPLAYTIIKLISQADKNYWIGTATLLLCELDRIAEQDLKIKISKLSSWPKSPGSLSRKIPQIKTLLRGAGIVIERPVDTGMNTKLIEIRKISPEAPVSPEDKNQAQKEHDNSRNIHSGNSLSSEISPEINGGNQAQKQQSGDTGDNGDILHMPTGTVVTGLDISIKEPYDNGKAKQDEEKPIGLEKFGSSTSNNEYGNNQSCEDKPTITATISELTTNDSAATSATISTTIATATNNAIYRLGGTDIWACKNCKIKADKHFMQKHNCSGKK